MEKKHYTGEQILDALCEAEIDPRLATDVMNALARMPSAEPEEVIPHQNYKYFSDYWCECGWHLVKKGDVKYCAECGRKVKWDG